MERARNVAIVVYEKVDTLDVAGPFDVFAVASRWGQDFHVYLVGERREPLRTVSGLSLVPRYALSDCPEPDVLVVPGGLGARTEMHNAALTQWIRSKALQAEVVLSVCTGALLLAKAGLLEGLRVTTNRRAFDLLREAAPAGSTIVEDVRYVDNGQVVMSAGVTAGMDAALHVVARLHGEERALDAASMLEHEWRREMVVRPACSDDWQELQRLYIEVAAWIRAAKGIRQWREEQFTPEYMESFVREHEVFVACVGNSIVGCFSIDWKYEMIWGERFHEDSGYVHRLAVSREHRGQGLGQRLLDWAEHEVKRRGKSWLRLDCMADNPHLNAYYRSLGFTSCGVYEGPGWGAHLYERKIR